MGNEFMINAALQLRLRPVGFDQFANTLLVFLMILIVFAL